MAYGTTNKYIVYEIHTQQITNDINTNSTWLKVWIDVWRTNTGYTTYGTGTVYCKINGTTYSAAISTSQKITNNAIRVGEWDVTIPHNADGTKSISITAWFSHSQFSSSEQGFNLTLNTIPRAAPITGFTSSTSYVNGKFTVTYAPQTTFTYYLRLSIPNVQQIHRASLGSQSAGSKSTTYTFTSAQLTTIYGLVKTADKVQIGAVIETYNGSTKVGESSESILTLTLPTTLVPSFTSVTATGVNLFGSLYLQGKSSIKLTINGAAGNNGSTITGYTIKSSDGSISYSGSSNTYTTSVLTKSGTITFTATVTDSRGRTASKTVSITVTAYSLPTLKMEAYRCTSAGVRDDANGTYIAVKPTFTYSAVTGNSISSKYIKIGGTSKSTAFNSGTVYTFGTYSLSSSYAVEVYIKDAVGNEVKLSVTIGIGKIPAHFRDSKNGIGFGRFCTVDGQMQVAYDLNLFGSFMINGKEQLVFELVGTVDVTI